MHSRGFTRTPTIVFTQEHWQFEEQLHKLNIYNRHMAIAVSGMDSSSHIQLGRLYGGVAIIWDKNINNYIQSIDNESKRVAAVLFTNVTVNLLTYFSSGFSHHVGSPV